MHLYGFFCFGFTPRNAVSRDLIVTIPQTSIWYSHPSFNTIATTFSTLHLHIHFRCWSSPSISHSLSIFLLRYFLANVANPSSHRLHVHLYYIGLWQAMLISTLILSLAPLLIWSQSAPPPPQSHSLSPYSRTPSPSQSPDSSCNDPNCSKSCIGGK